MVALKNRYAPSGVAASQLASLKRRAAFWNMSWSRTLLLLTVSTYPLSNHTFRVPAERPVRVAAHYGPGGSGPTRVTLEFPHLPEAASEPDDPQFCEPPNSITDLVLPTSEQADFLESLVHSGRVSQNSALRVFASPKDYAENVSVHFAGLASVQDAVRAGTLASCAKNRSLDIDKTIKLTCATEEVYEHQPALRKFEKQSKLHDCVAVRNAGRNARESGATADALCGDPSAAHARKAHAHEARASAQPTLQPAAAPESASERKEYNVCPRDPFAPQCLCNRQAAAR